MTKAMRIGGGGILRYGAAVAAVGLAVLLRFWLESWGGGSLPTFITFYPVIMVAALLGGFWPGITATLLSAATVDYWIVGPGEFFNYANRTEWVSMVLFVAMGIFMSTVAGLYRNTRTKAAAYDMERALLEQARRTEEATKKTLEELRRSNEELERFGYVASHDLQEPLRQVRAFAEILAERYGDKLDRQAAEYMRFITEGASRMSELIQDLLTYSRVGSRDLRHQPVSCQTALDRALANLSANIQESQARVTHDPLPTVLSDPTQLSQLFQNLVSNAIKFRREGVVPEVHVGCRRAGAQCVFSVRDNGIGIAPEHYERIFVVFQRLHSRSSYAGTGIGLAICRKIVEQHGGRIWVESQEGKGSTFFFTLLAT